MIVDPIVFYTLVLITLVLGVGLAVIVSFYSKSLKDIHSSKKELERLKSKIEEKGEDKLDTARDLAEKIIDEANSKAQEIIVKANNFDNKEKMELQGKVEILSKNQSESLEKTSKELLEEYKKALEKLKEDNINVFRNISKEVEVGALDEVKDFRAILEKETLSAQKIVERKIEEQYSLAQKEIDEYKIEKLKKIEKSIYDVLRFVSENTLGKALSLQGHQELVLKALEKARKENKINF